MVIWQLIKREFRLFINKEPKIIFLIFGAPLAYMTLFGILYMGNVVKYVPTVVYDQDQSMLSRQLIEAFEDSEKYQVVAMVSSQEEMEEYMRTKEAKAAIGIPPNFSQHVKKGLSSEVLIEVNGTNLVVANIVMSAAQEIMQDFSAGVARGLVEQLGQLPTQSLHKVLPVELRVHVLNNPTLGYTNFFVLGLMVTALQAGILLGLGCSFVHEYEPKHMLEMQQIPVGILFLGKYAVYLVLGMISFGVALFSSYYFFMIPFKGNILSLLLVGMTFISVLIALSGLIAGCSRGEVSYTQISLAIAMPSFIYSGYTWPLHAMNMPSYLLAHIFPVTYVAEVVRDIMVAGYSPDLFMNALYLFFEGSLLFSIAMFCYARRRKQMVNMVDTISDGIKA